MRTYCYAKLCCCVRLCCLSPGSYADIRDSALARPGADSSFNCLPCPKGGDCELPGTTLSTLAAASGYWRPQPNGTAFLRCINSKHCAGGVNSST
jgi:hypothetical protein